MVSVARATPCATASSKLFSELELISVIRATDMITTFPRDNIKHGPYPCTQRTLNVHTLKAPSDTIQ
jgi:hypothetical protein